MNLPLISETIIPINPLELENLKIIPPKLNNQIAIVFDNFLRDQITFNLIKSIFLFCPGVKLYISDQSVFNPVTNELYTKLIQNGHCVIYCGFDCGISVAKNRAISNVTEPYIFTCDSDNIFTEKTNLESLIYILQRNKKLGYLNLLETRNGIRIEYEINLSLENNTIIYNNAHIDENPNELLFCDYTTNEGLFKKEIFQDVKFDEEMKLAEHLDFFMQLKYNSPWKVAYTTLSAIDNQDIKIDDVNYLAYRNRNTIYWQLYTKKWNIDCIVDLKNRKYWLNSEKNISIPIEENSFKTKIPQQMENTSITIKKNYSKNPSLEERLKEFSLFLTKNNIDHYLLSDTCRQYVLRLPLKLPITLGISEKSDWRTILKNNKYTFFKDNELNIVEWIPTEYKLGDNLSNIKYRIPFPVVKYLEKTFSKNWKNLTNE